MKLRPTILAFSFLLLPLVAGAETNMYAVLESMPDELMPYVNFSRLAPLLHLYELGETDTIDNYFGGQSYIKAFKKHNYFCMSVAQGVDVEIKVVGDSLYLMRHYCAPLCSSRVEVYDMEWNKQREVLPPHDYLFPYAQLTDSGIVWTDQQEPEQPLLH